MRGNLKIRLLFLHQIMEACIELQVKNHLDREREVTMKEELKFLFSLFGKTKFQKTPNLIFRSQIWIYYPQY